jgi:hypothetical protein
MQTALKVTMDARPGVTTGSKDAPTEVPMSYAEAKEIALLRLELRACWDREDRVGGRASAMRLAQVAGNDNELAAEARRWVSRFAA